MNERAVRVLMLVENNPYPMDFRVFREASTLRDAGYSVTVIAPSKAGQPWHERLDGIDVLRFPAPAGANGLLGYALEFGYATLAMLVLSLWVALRKGVDIVHAANPPDTLFVIGAFFKLAGKKYVFDHHDLSPEIYQARFDQPRRNPVFHALRALERLSFMTADVVISTNASYRNVALHRGHVSPGKVFIVRNGPPLSYVPAEADAALRARSPHLIGYIGTIGPQDGLAHWLRAIHSMVTTYGRRDFLAVIIGDGDALPAVRLLARQLEIEPYVHFTGRLAEAAARRCLSTVDVCVQPDPLNQLNDQSTMNKLMEYMALGKPTVAFDLVETRFSARDAALYVKPNDEQAFAERTLWLLDRPQECQRMGELGRQRVSSLLAWEYSAVELRRAYSEGLGVGSARAHRPERLNRPPVDMP